MQALEGVWRGDCSPDTVFLFVKEMLEQVVLRGQGGYGKYLAGHRHVESAAAVVRRESKSQEVDDAPSTCSRRGGNGMHALGVDFPTEPSLLMCSTLKNDAFEEAASTTLDVLHVQE